MSPSKKAFEKYKLRGLFSEFYGISYEFKKKIELESSITWKLVTCHRITSKKYLTSMGRHLSPRYGQATLVRGYPVLTAVNWSKHWCWCWICVHYQFSRAPKLAKSMRFVVYFGFVQTESGQVLYTTALLQLNQLFICTMISRYNLRLGCG